MSKAEFGPFWEKKLRSFFKRLDFEKKGKMTKNTYETLADRYIDMGHMQGVAAKQVRRKLVKLWDDFYRDSATDGAVDENAFIKAIKQREEILLKGVLLFLGLWFDVIDLNGDGLIQKEEYKLLFKAFGIEPGAADEAFKLIDTNKDGQISNEEFIHYGCQYFMSNDESLQSKYMFGPLV